MRFSLKDQFESIILTTSVRCLTPFILIYGVYVLFHGEYSPGGGFQAGALFGIAVVLDRLVQGKNAVLFVKGYQAVIMAGVGTFIYALVGILTILFGGNFLEYAALPFSVPEAERHALGILGIEIGVTICVMTTIIIIFDALTRGKE